MKEFIYLDTSFLNSYIAQIFEGLPSNIMNEYQESRTESHTDKKQSERSRGVQTEVGALGAKIGVKFAPKEISSESFFLEQLEAGKEIISKQLHDNAVNDLIGYLRDNSLLVEDLNDIQLNKYILYRSQFSIVDVSLLHDLVKSPLMKLMNRQSNNKQKQGQEQIIKQMREMLDFLLVILPSEMFLRQQKLLAPLKKQHLREQPKELIFKYGEEAEVLLLGRVTRRFQAGQVLIGAEIQTLSNLSDMLLKTADDLLVQLQVIQNGDYVISPIAIFFE